MRVSKSSILVVLALLAIIAVMPIPRSVSADAQSPYSTISVGDWWRYSIQTSGSGFTETGTMTETIASSATVLFEGSTVDCYLMSVAGSGSFTGSGVSGTFTLSGSAYSRRSDLAPLTGNITVTVVAGFTLTQTTHTNNSPLVAPYQFPLSVGKTWSVNYNTTNTVTTFTSINPTPQVTTTTTHTSRTFSVTSSSVMPVGAGSFEAYDVHSSDQSSYTDDYYSPQVENTIKSTEYNSTTGLLISSQSLEDFRAWPYQVSLTLTKNGSNYNGEIMSDATISNNGQNSTAITFRVSGTDGVAGRANVTLPMALNSTSVKVYVDANLVAPTVSKNSTALFFYFIFGLSTHTVTLQYAATPSGLSLTNALLVGGIVAAAVIIITVLLLLSRRGKPSPFPVTAEPQPTSAPPVPPPSDAPPTA